MKLFIYIILALASGLLIYNTTLIDPQNPLKGESNTALIGVMAALSVILLVTILLISKKIDAKSKKQ